MRVCRKELTKASSQSEDTPIVIYSDDDATSDTFERDSEETEEESTEDESETVTDEEVTEEEEEAESKDSMELEDDEEPSKARRTGRCLGCFLCLASVTGRKRNNRSKQSAYEDNETNASTIMCVLLLFLTSRVSLGDDVDISPHVEMIVYRQTLPIYRWISILRSMNTRYLINGSRLDPDRWVNIPESRTPS